MARKKGKSGKRGPDGLPQRFDVWQADIRPMKEMVQTDAGPVTPWIVLVLSTTEGVPLFFELVENEPDAAVVWHTLTSAMTVPQSGEPHRPTEVQLPAAAAWAPAVRERLEALGVQAPAIETLAEIDEMCAGLFEGVERLLTGSDPLLGLLGTPYVTPKMCASLFEAAARFFEQAPWKKIDDRPIRVQTDQIAGGPWYAVVIGQGGSMRGLILYDTLEQLLENIESHLSAEESSQQLAALALNYGTTDDIPAADLESIQEYGWIVAAANAYPMVYRIDPGLVMRPPMPWEIQLFEGCLRSLPVFMKKKTRRLKPLELTVPTATGELTLTLDWADQE